MFFLHRAPTACDHPSHEDRTVTQTRIRARWTLIIWVPVLLIFLAIFFSGGGPAGYAGESIRHLLAAILFLVGFVIYLIMIYRTRLRPGGPEKDERDETIEKKAQRFAFVAVLAFVYALSILLWVIYEGDEYVPAGWLWFMGYATVFFGMISSAASALFLEREPTVHGEG